MRRSVIVFCVLIVIAGRVWHHWPQTEENPYAFTLPTMFFQTLEFPMPQDGSTIYGWKFEQCVRMNFAGFTGTLHMPGSYEFSGYPCGPIALAGSPTAASITFGPGDKVRFDEMDIRK